MTTRPATAGTSAAAGPRQLPPNPRRVQQRQQQQQHHQGGPPNGHSSDRKLLRTLNSHPPSASASHSHQSFNRPRFSPYTPPLSSSMPIGSGGRSGRIRHATVSTDLDITDPRIYPTEMSSSRDQREAQAAAMSRSYDCAFFSAGAAAGRGHGRRGEFVIHPEWLSESVSIERLRINERPLIMPAGSHQQKQQQLLQHQQSLPNNWPKRCRSAPPPPQQQHPQNQHQSSINPITWQ